MLAEIDERSVGQPGRAELQLAQLRCTLGSITTGPRPAEDEDPCVTPDPLSPERLQLADAGILYLSPVVGQLIELWRGPENDDYGRLRPTREAFDKTIELLVDTAIVGHFDQRAIPHGCVSTDSDGGVRIEWIRDKAKIHLVVPTTKNDRAYVYHEVGSDFATEDVTPERLSDWLSLIT